MTKQSVLRYEEAEIGAIKRKTEMFSKYIMADDLELVNESIKVMERHVDHMKMLLSTTKGSKVTVWEIEHRFKEARKQYDKTAVEVEKRVVAYMKEIGSSLV